MEDDECRLLQGVVGYAAQGLLILFVIVSLAYKRHREIPQRPVKIWALDVSKQVFSAGFAHLCNMAIAKLASIKANEASPCAWYFVVFTLDTTLGVSLTVLFHRLFVSGAKRVQQRRHSRDVMESELKAQETEHWWDSIAKCGSYGEPPSLKTWGWQMAEWTLATLIARVICGWLIVVLKDVGVHLARVLDQAFDGHPNFELLFVMVMCPIGMNIIQAWIQDAVLKRKKQMPQAGLVELDRLNLLEGARGSSHDEG